MSTNPFQDNVKRKTSRLGGGLCDFRADIRCRKVHSVDPDNRVLGLEACGSNISVSDYSGRFLDDHTSDRMAQTIKCEMRNIMDHHGEVDRTPDNSILEEEAKIRLLRSLNLIIPFASYEM
jgi:hypothetical protein